MKFNHLKREYFHIKIYKIPQFIVFLYIITLIINYSFYGINLQYNGFIPTISETAVEFPGNIIFTISFIIIDCLEFVVLRLFLMYYKKKKITHNKLILNLFSISTFIMWFLLFGLSICNIEMSERIHILFANCCFIIFVLISLLITILSIKLDFKSFLQKLIFFIFSIIGMMTMMFSVLFMNYEYFVSYISLGELIFVSSLIFLTGTLSNELFLVKNNEK